ncbi:MAG: hypothetical protein FIA99_07230 [Ruminiclostridium sp.]|nr:hypothetical protein [Ruminiclostridium sp.]
MSKTLFLEYFQENLREAIEELITKQWGYKEYTVCCEKHDITGKFKGFIDICIEKESSDSSILAIEIEHLSGYDQAIKNIEKLKAWAHNSNYRKCSLLHIFNEDCYVGKDYISELIKHAKVHERKGLGFYYDFAFYKVKYLRKTRQIATDLVFSPDFETRIWMLLEAAEMT